MAQHNVYTIPFGYPFAKTLARHLLQETDGRTEELTRYKLLLPTRRACRLLRETFLALNEGKPLLLPQMTPIGEVDEEALSLMMFDGGDSFLNIPESIAPMRRSLLMAKLIRSIPDFAGGYDHALDLANALCNLIDQVVVEGLDFADLHKIVPDEFAKHWQITLDFLKIISENWPHILEEQGVIDVAQRRNILLDFLARHWEEHPPVEQVIAAGSTGSIPAAAQLLSVIEKMQNGRVILPGLDQIMDDESWSYITESHPQYALKTTLARMGVERHDVKPLEIVQSLEQETGRFTLASEFMLPAQSCYQWKNFAQRFDVAPYLNNLNFFACKTQQDEASLIALYMREGLEDKDCVTALVTPDRGLARRVSAICRRWGIEVDDSAGMRLLDTRLGKFMALSLQVACGTYNPVALLALMKISFCRFRQNEPHYKKMLEQLETKVLRGQDLISSHDVLRKKIKGNAALSEYMDGFYAALYPLQKASQDKEVSFEIFLNAHIEVLEKLTATSDQEGAEILWRGDTGEEAASFLSELMQHTYLIGELEAGEYEKAFYALMKNITVRSAYGVHPRLLILGQMEARLSDADLVILGGLNEGTWPPESGHDPWMSRPMRKSFGLPSSDQMIGLSAHDFVQGFCAKKVVMTRAEKVDGSPTVPARWLDRLDTLLQASGHSLSDLTDINYMNWAHMLDEHDDLQAYMRPSPCPPISTRPKCASVTKIDTWLKDPYAIYMYYVLNLRKMNPLLQDNDAALRGNVLHEILDRFTNAYPLNLPDDAEEKFIEISKDVFDDMVSDPDALQYWWPKCVKIAAWFVAHERDWRMDAKFMASEIRGNVDLDVDGVPFNIQGTADRIDRKHGGYAIIDYKTGGTFSAKKLKDGALPQMPIEAMMLALGGFNGRGFKGEPSDVVKKYVPAGDIAYMGYWKMTGGAKVAELFELEGDLSESIQIVEDGLVSLIRMFRQAETPFLCLPDTRNMPRYNDYELVSRLKEWAALDDDADGEVA